MKHTSTLLTLLVLLRCLGLHAAEHPLVAPAPLVIDPSGQMDEATRQTARKTGHAPRRQAEWLSCSVITQGDRAFIFYQCGAGVQAAELKCENGVLTCDRDAPFNFNPQWSLAPKFHGGGAP